MDVAMPFIFVLFPQTEFEPEYFGRMQCDQKKIAKRL